MEWGTVDRSLQWFLRTLRLAFQTSYGVISNHEKVIESVFGSKLTSFEGGGWRRQKLHDRKFDWYNFSAVFFVWLRRNEKRVNGSTALSIICLFPLQWCRGSRLGMSPRLPSPRFFLLRIYIVSEVRAFTLSVDDTAGLFKMMPPVTRLSLRSSATLNICS